jgi:hypothetical protein
MNDTEIRERLLDLAAEAPQGFAAPPPLLRRARRRVALVATSSAMIILALIAGGIAGARRLGASDRRPAVRPSPSEPHQTPLSGPFDRARGWIAYNDGGGIWAVDPGKAYPGTFSPNRFPDDTVRLAGPAAGDPIAWSADGSRLLVSRGSRGNDLIVLDADGTETPVTDSAQSGKASISPDGTRVAYVAQDGGLELATVGGAPPEVLPSTKDGNLDSSPAFSPDGRRIAFIYGGGDHSNALWVIDADGTNRRKLAGGDWAHVHYLVWSPDGERLAFSCGCSPAGRGVYTIRADGSRLTLVSADESMPMPQWSPDGSQIALVHELAIPLGRTTGTLVVVGAEGGEEHEILRFQLFRANDLGDVRQVTIAWNHAG